MAFQTSFTLEEEELSCPICFEDFDQNDDKRHPKLLNCLHTFCVECIENTTKYDRSLLCPICRQSHKVYNTLELMDNYLIFEHLAKEQADFDEKLANQLREEYNEIQKRKQEQEEIDARLAQEDDEKTKHEEEERIHREAEFVQQLQQELEEEMRMREENATSESENDAVIDEDQLQDVNETSHPYRDVFEPMVNNNLDMELNDDPSSPIVDGQLENAFINEEGAILTSAVALSPNCPDYNTWHGTRPYSRQTISDSSRRSTPDSSRRSTPDRSSLVTPEAYREATPESYRQDTPVSFREATPVSSGYSTPASPVSSPGSFRESFSEAYRIARSPDSSIQDSDSDPSHISINSDENSSEDLNILSDAFSGVSQIPVEQERMDFTNSDLDDSIVCLGTVAAEKVQKPYNLRGTRLIAPGKLSNNNPFAHTRPGHVSKEDDHSDGPRNSFSSSDEDLNESSGYNRLNRKKTIAHPVIQKDHEDCSMQ